MVYEIEQDYDYAVGATVYRLNLDIHNNRGPAVIYDDGDQQWYLFGECHRYYGHPRTWYPTWEIHGKYIK